MRYRRERRDKRLLLRSNRKLPPLSNIRRGTVAQLQNFKLCAAQSRAHHFAVFSKVFAAPRVSGSAARSTVYGYPRVVANISENAAPAAKRVQRALARVFHATQLIENAKISKMFS